MNFTRMHMGDRWYRGDPVGAPPRHVGAGQFPVLPLSIILALKIISSHPEGNFGEKGAGLIVLYNNDPG
jgi:hypothetical protein